MNKIRLGAGVLFVACSLISGATVIAAAEQDPNGQATSATLAEHYLVIQEALAGDSLELVSEHAAALHEMTTAMTNRPRKGGHPGNAAVAAASERLTLAADMGEARLAFGELSELLVRAGDFVPADGLKLAYCPMADKHWLQTGDQIANPYYGASMLRCGGFVDQPGSTATK